MSMQNISSINSFILEIQQIIESCDLKGHTHIWPCPPTHISLPIGNNGKQLSAIGKFSSAIGKLMIGKTLATNGEEITNAMTGNDILGNYW